jgi:hypothetical protein
LKKEQTTTDDMDLGSARGSRAGFGGLAETIFFTTQHTKIFGIRNAGRQTRRGEKSRKGISAMNLEIAAVSASKR